MATIDVPLRKRKIGALDVTARALRDYDESIADHGIGPLHRHAVNTANAGAFALDELRLRYLAEADAARERDASQRNC